MKKKKIGFIGYKGHASRLIKIFDELEGCEASSFYHPEKRIDLGQLPVREKARISATRDLSDLYSCDGIVISTPNHTHFGYLKRIIKEYSGYIFCEKPPETEPEDLSALAEFTNSEKRRIHFNFNMRFSLLSDILNSYPEKYDLGKILKVSVTVGHGLGFKESYSSSWRSKAALHKGGVFETLGIHYFDLVSFFLGPPTNFFYEGQTHSQYGDSTDTSHLSCVFADKGFLNLTSSYCGPFIENMHAYFTNGYIDFDSGRTRVFGPRDTFDKNGFFAQPPVIYEATSDMDTIYTESLSRSCSQFLKSITEKKKIDLKYFEQSLCSNKMCLDIIKRDKR